jgi:UDP-3-O-[3-hydroxymyristoyl] glucosamine N-acyltransferase
MPDSNSSGITLGELATQLELRLKGDASVRITSVASIKSATSSDICFLQSPAYLKSLQHSACAAVIVPQDFDQEIGAKSLLYANNPHLYFIRVINLLNAMTTTPKAATIHASAQVAESALIGENVSIGANCVIGEAVKLAEGVTIGAACVIEDGCKIGPGSVLHPRVTLCHDVEIGSQVILHPGVVIGSDGFGLVYDQGSWVKIPHLGSVVIADRVEIGANTTVDRGALDDTVIQQGVKLDNLVQVAHNVVIGENTAIAACVGIAGSAIIGKNCRISGAAVVLGHLSIADGVTITAMSLVTKSIHKSGTYSSGTPLMENRLWHRNNARYKSLDKLAKSISGLEKK